MTKEYKNCIIWLIGHPGVGKLTTGKAICKQTNFRLIDGHKINNLVFPFVQVDGSTPMPKEIWDRTADIRAIMFKTLRELGNREFSFIFTNCLYNDDKGDWAAFHTMKDIAEDIDATFMPVILQCDLAENQKRIVNKERRANYKMTDADLLAKRHENDIIKTAHPHEFVCDNTALTAKESAKLILAKLDTLLS